MIHKDLTLRPFHDGDIQLMTAWLHKDYIQKWYHDPEDWLEEINRRHDTYSWIHHFIVMDGETPIGFCQYYDCYDANNLEDWYTVSQRGHTFSIDYLIGDEAHLGKGCGKAIVKLLTDMVKRMEQAAQIIVQPDEDNHASNKVLLANGYTFDQTKGFYIKRLDEPFKS